jgi:hypothetical protein
MSSLLDSIESLPAWFCTDPPFADFCLDFLPAVPVEFAPLVLIVLAKALYLSPAIFDDFIGHDPARLLLSIAENLPPARPIVFVIVRKIVESDSIYCIRSGLFGDFLAREPEEEVVGAYLEVLGAFLRNHDPGDCEPFAALILEAVQAHWADSLLEFTLPILSDLCALGFGEMVISSLSIADLFSCFGNRKLRHSFGDLARLAVQLISIDQRVIGVIPISAIIDRFEKCARRKHRAANGRAILLLLTQIAECGFLSVVLRADSKHTLFIAANERSFEFREAIVRMYWRGFIAMPRRSELIDSPAFLLMCCGPVPRELVAEGLDALASAQHEGAFTDQNTREILTEFLNELVTDDEPAIAERAQVLLKICCDEPVRTAKSC